MVNKKLSQNMQQILQLSKKAQSEKMTYGQYAQKILFEKIGGFNEKNNSNVFNNCKYSIDK